MILPVMYHPIIVMLCTAAVKYCPMAVMYQTVAVMFNVLPVKYRPTGVMLGSVQISVSKRIKEYVFQNHGMIRGWQKCFS